VLWVATARQAAQALGERRRGRLGRGAFGHGLEPLDERPALRIQGPLVLVELGRTSLEVTLPCRQLPATRIEGRLPSRQVALERTEVLATQLERLACRLGGRLRRRRRSDLLLDVLGAGSKLARLVVNSLALLDHGLLELGQLGLAAVQRRRPLVELGAG
jgi:hypothetical protein